MYITYLKLILLIGALTTVFVSLYAYQINKARKRLFLTNAMLETDNNIMELSHQEQQETLHRLKISDAMLDTGCNIMDMGHSELLESIRDLTEANERAKEALKTKNNFIKQISHEIRTPLNILSGYTQIISTPGLNLGEQEKRHFTQDIMKNTDRITELVNKMLELSEISSTTVIQRTDSITARELVTYTMSKNSIKANPDVTFTLEMNEEIGRTPLLTHLITASRALTHILDNALKFSAESNDKQICLRVTSNDDYVVYAVEDRGIGVPTNEAEHIFDKFVQLDEFYEGTGIGLTIARNQANRLGGDVTLDTTYSPGARFELKLPRARHGHDAFEKQLS